MSVVQPLVRNGAVNNFPNPTTKKAITDIRKKNGLTSYESVNDMFTKFGL